ncbi:MAG: hypothetical protein H7Y17_14075 [Chlorobia bacterium]|nr:hypothetical protein [Fimbriimonadaceae bacterium]
MNPEVIASVAFFGLVFVAPVVWMLTKHQQKMTLLLQGDGSKQGTGNQDVRQELAALREIASQQTIALDNLARSQMELKNQLTAREELSQRIG